MRRNYFVAQENINDCGVACLLMILKAHGGNMLASELKVLTKTNKRGTNAFSLVEAAKKIGFKAEGFRCDQINQINSFPCIGHVVINNDYHHYVVIRKLNYKKQQVLISDPAVGNKWLSFAEFTKIWTKVIIACQPERPLIKLSSNRKLISYLLTLIKPQLKRVGLVLLLSFLVIGLNIINALYLKLIVDEYGSLLIHLSYLFLFFAIVVILKAIADYVRNYLLIVINKNVSKALIMDTYNRLISLPYSYFSNQQTGDLMARINDLNYVSELIGQATLILFVDFILIIIAMLMLGYLNFTLFMIVLMIILLYLVVVCLYSLRIKNYIKQSQLKKGVFYSSLVETIKGLKTIINLNIKSKIKSKVSNKFADLLENNYAFACLINRQATFKNIILGVGFNLILYVSSVLYWRQQITLGEIVLFNSLLVYFMEPIKSIFEAEPLLRNALNALERIMALARVEVSLNKGNVKQLKGAIKVRNLAFSYDDLNYVFTNLNLNIKAQSKVLITGASGSGKSTLAKLLCGYYKTPIGTITIGGIALKDYHEQAFANDICYISQNETLFSDSLYYNLVLDRTLAENKVAEIKEIMGIKEILLKRGIDDSYLIAENGSNFSGGERQRFILGRSFLKEANVYILDESTNEMNSSLERFILNQIFKRFADKTIIVIGHRLTNKDLFDQVISLPKEEGGKNESINKGGITTN